jgi:putative spermidine/putrescine transport system permease protein
MAFITRSVDHRAWLLMPAVLIIVVAFIIPTAWLLVRSFSEPTWGLQNFRTMISDPVYGKVAWNTVSMSASVTVLCLLLGYPFAYAIAHARPGMRKLLMLTVLVPLWTSLLVRSFAWMVLLQDNGVLNSALLALRVIAEPIQLIYNSTGVLIAVTQVQLSLMILPLYAVMSRIDPNVTRAASTLGAPPVMTFLRVYLPLSVPGIISGCTLVFVLCLGYYVTPALVGGRRDIMVGQLIVLNIGELGNWGMAAALSLTLLVGTMTVFGLLTWAAQGSRRWMTR